jgi:hypothetical protein
MSILTATIALTLSSVSAAQAQAPPEPPHDTTELAKKTQNPVGDLISLPFQFNFNTGGGLQDATFFNVNIQPVIPFRLTENWNAISRTIVPVSSVPGPDGGPFSGFGDIQEEFFITPARPGAVIWGVGPALSVPTATAAPLRTGTWAMGPTAVVVKMTGAWVLGGLVAQWWPMTDNGGEPETDLFLLQPFINYNFGKGYALAFAPMITANWDAPSGQEWTVPLGIGISRTTVFNRRPIQIGVQYYYNIEHPDSAAGQTVRFVLSLLYPTAKP